MTRDETIKLLAECEAKRTSARADALARGQPEYAADIIGHKAAKAHWNAWATTVRNKREALKKEGQRFSVGDVRFSQCIFLMRRNDQAQEKPADNIEAGEGQSPVTPIVVVDEKINMSGFIFPGFTSFKGAVFRADVSFDHAIFDESASFESTIFEKGASFTKANLGALVFFNRATFESYASFGEATFRSNDFDRVNFKKTAWFIHAIFSDNAKFNGARFEGRTFFAFATFNKGATFDSATFLNRTTFSYAKFGSKENKADVDFTALKVERAFDLTGAYFSKVPSFRRADFKQAPDLDGVDFPLPDAEPFVIGNPDLIPKYRAIRRMAIQGADYESEHKAFKGELRSRRWRIDKWWYPSAWLGVLYDGIADCGRSISQPAIAWAATIIVFAAFYGSRALADAENRCAEGGGPFVQALYLSVKNGLVLFAGTRDARVNQAYACLYGGTAEQPHIPPSVTFVETLLQFPISAVLIFLGLLAVKNRFKIK